MHVKNFISNQSLLCRGSNKRQDHVVSKQLDRFLQVMIGTTCHVSAVLPPYCQQLRGNDKMINDREDTTGSTKLRVFRRTP